MLYPHMFYFFHCRLEQAGEHGKLFRDHHFWWNCAADEYEKSIFKALFGESPLMLVLRGESREVWSQRPDLRKNVSTALYGGQTTTSVRCMGWSPSAGCKCMIKATFANVFIRRFLPSPAFMEHWDFLNILMSTFISWIYNYSPQLSHFHLKFWYYSFFAQSEWCWEKWTSFIWPPSGRVKLKTSEGGLVSALDYDRMFSMGSVMEQEFSISFMPGGTELQKLRLPIIMELDFRAIMEPRTFITRL